MPLLMDALLTCGGPMDTIMALDEKGVADVKRDDIHRSWGASIECSLYKRRNLES